MKQRALLTLAAVLAAPLAFASVAHAAPMLSLTLAEAGYTSETFTSTTGFLSFGSAGGFGTFSTVAGNAAGVPMIGTTSTPQIDLNSLNVAGSSGTLTMTLSETGLAIGPGTASVGGSIGGTNSGTISVQQAILASNNGGASYMQIAQSPVLGTTSFASDIGGSYTFSGNDALEEVITVTATGSANNSFDAHESVPEPTSIALLGSGLLLFGMAGARRQKI